MVSICMRTKVLLALVGLAATTLCAGTAIAKVKASDTTVLAVDRILSPAIQPMYVSSPAVQAGQPIPEIYTGFGKDISPMVSWDGAPPEAAAYVLIMEDADAPGGEPAVHWLIYNIPGAAKGLPRNVRNRGEPKSPPGSMQGINYAGGVGYIGPKPPAGDKPHHYHIQVFALNRPLDVKPKADLDQVIAAMNDRVLAEGDVVGTFAAPTPGQPMPRGE